MVCARANPLQRSPERQCPPGPEGWRGVGVGCAGCAGCAVCGREAEPIGSAPPELLCQPVSTESMPKSTAARRRLLLEFSYTFPPCLQLPRSSFHPPSSNNSAQSLVLAPRVQCAHLLLFSPPTPSRSAVQASSTVSFARTTSTRPHHQCSCLPAREPGFFRVTACLQPGQQGSQN